MMCPKCGTQILEGEKFCKGCGSQIAIPQSNDLKENKEKIKYWTIPIIMFFLGIFLYAIALLFDGIIGENNILSIVLITLSYLSILLSIPTFFVAYILEIRKNKNYWGIPILIFIGGIVLGVIGLIISKLFNNDSIYTVFTTLASLCWLAIFPSIIVVLILKTKNKNK